jgi:hypothetical protein
MLLTSASTSETVPLLVVAVLGLVIATLVYLVPGVFDAATRMRLRMQGLPEDDKATLERDRTRRRFIALVLAVGSGAILADALNKL